MRNVQTPKPGPQHSKPKAWLHPDQHMSAATSTTPNALHDSNVTVLRPKYLDHVLAAFNNGAPYTGIQDVSSSRKKPFSLVRPLTQDPFDTYRVTKTIRLIPLYILPEENKPHDYRGEGPTNQ